MDERPVSPVMVAARTLAVTVTVSLIATTLGGCALIAVAEAAVAVVATGVKVTARAVGGAVDAVTPDGDEEEE
jgi:hypothetical protein